MIIIEYHGLPSVLKRYSFESKMAFAYQASINTMSLNGQKNSDVLCRSWLPDEIETYVMLASTSKEWGHNALDAHEFWKVLNAIRNFMPSKLKAHVSIDFSKWLLVGLGATQFEGEETSYYRLYRHHYYFTLKNKNIDVNAIFHERFNFQYDDLMFSVWALWLWICIGRKDSFEKLIKENSIVFSSLALERSKFNNEVQLYASDFEDYRYSLRPSYSYPFIIDNGVIYLPTPHLLLQAATSSIMYRLTEGNDSIRETIGKEVYETYLIEILKDSSLFDKVCGELVYDKNSKRSVDAIAFKGENVLLFDSKSFSPKARLRIFSESDYSDAVNKLSKMVKQMYAHLTSRFGHEYCQDISIDHEHLYGIIVVYSDANILMEDIYQRAASELKISINSDTYDWLY